MIIRHQSVILNLWQFQHHLEHARAQEFLKGGRILDCWCIFEISYLDHL